MADFNSKGKGPYLVAILGGLLASVVTTNACRAIGIWGTDWYYLVLAAAYLVVGLAIIWSSTRLSFAPLIVVYAAIPFGVFLDAAFDLSVWNNDRNLFPFEIAVQLMFAWAPLMVGAFIGRSVRSNKQSQSRPQSGPAAH